MRPSATAAPARRQAAARLVAEGVEHPGRVIGLHYFYHPAKNRLVEVIPGAASDPKVVRRAWALQEQLGKLSHDVQAGLNVLEERQRAAGEQMPHLNINDYPEAQ